jgi:hypothetical protein
MRDNQRAPQGALFFEFCIMIASLRLRSAARAALLHLACSVIVALLAAWLVFGVWYPAPFDELTGGRGLFTLIVVVDVVCGPLLTLVLYNPAKSRAKWHLDLALIILVQLAALAYGLSQVALARPVFLAFEGNRYRVVQAFDIDKAALSDAPPPFQTLSYRGPQLIAAKLTASTDPNFAASLQLSLAGMHPAFRPSRWVVMDEQAELLRTELISIDTLRKKRPERSADIDRVLAATGLPIERLGYLPLVREPITDWVAFVDRQTARPVAYLQVDGW